MCYDVAHKHQVDGIDNEQQQHLNEPWQIGSQDEPEDKLLHKIVYVKHICYIPLYFAVLHQILIYFHLQMVRSSHLDAYVSHYVEGK